MEHCCILVHTAAACAPTQLATVLAAWLHWYGCLDLQTAIQVSTKFPVPMMMLSISSDPGIAIIKGECFTCCGRSVDHLC